MNRWIEAFEQLNDTDLFADREARHSECGAPAPLNEPAKQEIDLGEQATDNTVSQSTTPLPKPVHK